MTVNDLTSVEAYQAELKKPGTVVIDFYSTQCPPCKVRWSDSKSRLNC